MPLAFGAMLVCDVRSESQKQTISADENRYTRKLEPGGATYLDTINQCSLQKLFLWAATHPLVEVWGSQVD